ncbi:DegV family protein [Mesobacillus maritimus]|uniref:DegV family protein n=1 Tax=Mesobacillus maritimus TaxID=1643336 RepID=UPI00203FE177|nr:DegV family protein [Mesobacillus maritimus]MCM3588640.1 DegV family protein [Mesobacillus maritimus]
MRKIAWVTDGTAVLDEELQNHPDLYIVPLSVILDGEVYTEGVDLTAEELYAKLKVLSEPPKTSQPAIGAFKELYEKLAEEYDEIIAILLSQKLSGTLDSSEQASKLLEKPVTNINSKILTYPQTALIKKGMTLAREGASVQEIKQKLEEIRDRNETYVLIGSLEQLHRSGRMSSAKFYLGSLLKVKPIISIQDGALEVTEKARSEKKAKEKIFSHLREAYKRNKITEVWLLYGLYPQTANEWKRELEAEFTEIQFSCYPLGAVIGVHAGEDTIGISWYNELQ